MRLKLFAIAMTALIVGSLSAPVEVLADPPSWAPAHGWRKQKNVEKREERAERRELRALRLNDRDATASNLNRSQARKLERQNRREELAELRRLERAEARREARRQERMLQRQQAFR